MTTLLLGILLIGFGFAMFTGRFLGLAATRMAGSAGPLLGAASVIAGLFTLASVSFVWIDADVF